MKWLEFFRGGEAMRMNWAFAFVAVTFLSGITSEHVSAQARHIRIENQLDPSPIAGQYTQVGGWTVLHSSGSYSCASGTSNRYTISGTPTLNHSDVSSPDYIRFHNVIITANNSGVCGRIYFWRKFLPGPSGTVDFDLSSAGALKRGNGGAVGSWVHFSGWLQHPATTGGEADGISGTWEHVGSLTGPPASQSAQDKHVTSTLSSWVFPPPSGVDENPDLLNISSARIMKGEIWFRLANVNDQLILDPNSGVTVTTASGGGGDPPPPTCQPYPRCLIFDPSLRDFVFELMDEYNAAEVAERLHRIEKHLGLPPLPEPKDEQLEEEKIPTEPVK